MEKYVVIFDNKVDLDVFVGNALVDMYLKCRMLFIDAGQALGRLFTCR